MDVREDAPVYTCQVESNGALVFRALSVGMVGFIVELLRQGVRPEQQLVAWVGHDSACPVSESEEWEEEMRRCLCETVDLRLQIVLQLVSE